MSAPPSVVSRWCSIRADLEGADVAVLGAPFDDGTSHRPGARFGPGAIRAADDGGRWGGRT